MSFEELKYGAKQISEVKLPDSPLHDSALDDFEIIDSVQIKSFASGAEPHLQIDDLDQSMKGEESKERPPLAFDGAHANYYLDPEEGAAA